VGRSFAGAVAPVRPHGRCSLRNDQDRPARDRRSEETAEVGGETAMADAEQQLDDQPANIHTHAIATE
jgi:hypothetical protein